MKRTHFSLIGAAAAMLVLILDSRAAAAAAADALNLCIRTVIPALFPFFLLSGYITGSMKSGKIAHLIGRIFHSDQNTGGILLTGLLGGYPVGAKLAAQEFRSGHISKEAADRLIWFCSQAGPSFLFGMAASQMGSSAYGWLLWIIQIISALSVAWMLPGLEVQTENRIPSLAVSWNDSMRASLFAMASVCGWVIIFSVIIQFLERWILWVLPESSQILICGMLELTNGCMLLGSVENVQLRFLIAVVILNFGGLCVFMQTASVADGINIKGYFRGKCLQTLFASLYAMIWLGHHWALIPLLCVFSLRILPFSRNRGSIPVKIGV